MLVSLVFVALVSTKIFASFIATSIVSLPVSL